MVSGMDWEPTSVMEDAGDVSAQSSSSSSINGNVNGSMNGAAKPAAVREVTAADRERARTAKEMGNDAFRAGRHADAVRLYSEAIDTDPSEAAYFTNRAAAYMSLHKYQDALEDCNQAASMQTSEPNVKTLTRLARCQLHVGHLDVAKATVQRALAIAPRDSAAMTLDAQIDRTTTHIAAFERYRDEKSYQLANIALDKVAVEVPVLPLAWRLMRADLYLRRNQLEKANSAAYDALRHSPSDPEALVLRAKVLLAMGSDLSKALQHAQAALRADPEHKTAIRLLRKCRKLETAKEDANAAFKAGKTEESVNLYTAALDMAMPEDAEEVDARGYRAIVYSNRANANAKLGKHDEAIADCTESLQLNDGYVKALRLRARSYLAVERYEEAVGDFKKAIEESSAAEAEPLKRELHNAEIDLKRSKKKDYYKILGVSKTATGVEIKKAYRKESLKHHPDKGGDEEKFKLCAEAFGILSDDTKRRRYDMGADDPEAEPGMGGFHGHGPEVNLADLFAAHGGMGGGGFGGGHGPSPFGFAGASGGGFPGGGGGGARRSYRPPPNFNF